MVCSRDAKNCSQTVWCILILDNIISIEIGSYLDNIISIEIGSYLHNIISVKISSHLLINSTAKYQAVLRKVQGHSCSLSAVGR